MAIYLVGYDLDKPGQDYEDLIAHLKQFSNWWHHLDSTWIVKSDLSYTQLRDDLVNYIDKSDKLLVVNIGGDQAAWYGFNEKGSAWLRNNL